MRCPFCGTNEDRVIDSRTSKDGGEIRRRRECEACKRRFTTYERIEDALPIVSKRDGRREPFDRDKLLRGLKRAAAKRPVSFGDLEKIAEEVERDICDTGDREVASKRIGEAVLPRLRKLDEVAYVRYASIYRDFRDVDEFMRELADLMRARKS
ncbi:MAG: transcriptional repressor NrdR [Deltaproteobacteria bacterium]|nr:MAG: transcriptional repressor NrdR [Deltaproteobacteria bacterium]